MQIDQNTWQTIIITAAVIISLWSMPWKAVALWKAAKNNDKLWFVVLFLFNTIAILEIFYIFVFSKKHGQPVKIN